MAAATSLWIAKMFSGGELTVVGLGPEVGIGAGVDQLHVDPHALAGALDAAFEDALHAELLGDVLDGEFGVAELLDRGARDHLQRADLGELRQDVVVDAVDEEDVVLDAAAIVEGQDGDRGTGVGDWRRRLVRYRSLRSAAADSVVCW